MTTETDLETRIWDALRDVEDPEFPISVVDMGLIVAVNVHGRRASLDITFTAMGCPAMDMIVDDIRERLLQEPDIRDVDIRIVWDPIWTKDRLTEEGKLQLREWGIAV